MSREQRVRDNAGLTFAAALAAEFGRQLEVTFCLLPHCGAAARRHYDFMLTGLREVESELAQRGIGFNLLLGDPRAQLEHFARAGALVCDFSPLTNARARIDAVATAVSGAVYEVDSRNIVPAWTAADKHVYAAHNLRRRHARMLADHLVEPGAPPELPPSAVEAVDWAAAARFVEAASHGEALTTPSGETAAAAALEEFIAERLTGYAELRGRPEADHQSRLSPYLHFGQLAALRVALEVRASGAPVEDVDAFLDELITWRELSDNFCLHNSGYSRVSGFPDWSRATLREHAQDPRIPTYDLEVFEQAETHDTLWNAAQLEMVKTGKMHNHMRMYWAKKILEWSASPSEAMRIAVLLNDRYELDGRDSNGYAGIAWAIGGVHDRPWAERAIFGKVRYMNEAGARRRFDVDAYITRVAPELLEQRLF
ncbi:MAG: deoxyribodipyrimidine photo-lyase [Solirubrobacterales bacterium]